ncbi:MAG: AraC family transcriptional regulator [Lachnospiraceae bacterium]|nr:AraC family transcriptional regulator [Lachnospiraceae bacterium]
MYWWSNLANRGFTELNPLLYGHEDCGPLQSFGFIIRDFWMIYYVDRGRGTFISDGEETEVGAGSLFFVRPGASTKIIADRHDPWYFHWIGFDGRLAERLAALPLVMEHVTDIFSHMDRVEEYSNMREEYLVSQLLLLLCEIFPAQKRKDYVSYVTNYIDTNYMRRISIEEIASELGIDRHYLARLFGAAVGKSMREYLVAVRMKEARRLLLSGLTCGETALAVGYSDQASFSRSYTRFYGIAPSSAAARP